MNDFKLIKIQNFGSVSILSRSQSENTGKKFPKKIKNRLEKGVEMFRKLFFRLKTIIHL